MEINENLYEWFPAGTDQQIKATLSELYATTTSYTELQKGSRPQKADDWKLIETKVKPLFNEGAWDDLAANFEEGIWTVVVPGGNAPDGSGFSISSGIEGRDEDEKFTFDDDGYTWIHATESPMTFETMINEETGTPVVLVDNIRFRLLAGTTNNETVWLDMKISYTFEQAADGSWDVGRWEHIIEKQGVATTQEELDALPAV